MTADIEELQEALRFIIETPQGQEIVDDIRPLADLLDLEIETVPQVMVRWEGTREIEMEVVTRDKEIEKFLRENWESPDEPCWADIEFKDQVQTLSTTVKVNGRMLLDNAEVAATGLVQAVEDRLNGFVAVETVSVNRRLVRYTVKPAGSVA
jgi:hypothetical protein